MARTLDEYLRLPYKVEVFKETDPEYAGWIARVPDLPGCITQADTFEELEAMIEDAMRAWLETAIERGIPIPEPKAEEEYSGKFVVRVPKSLHRQLVESSDAEGVSLNQYINVALAKMVGSASPGKLPDESIEDSSTPFWPGLNDAIRNILAAQRLASHAGAIDERLFAEWAGQQMHEIASFYRQGRFEEALSGIQVLLHIFKENAWRSVAINLWVQTLTFQQKLIEDMQIQQAEALQEEQLWAQMGDMFRQINQRHLRSIDSRADYSHASMQSEISLQSSLFGSKVQVTGNE